MRINYKAKLNVHARRGLLLACGWVLRRTRDQVAEVPRRILYWNFRYKIIKPEPPSELRDCSAIRFTPSDNLPNRKWKQTTTRRLFHSQFRVNWFRKKKGAFRKYFDTFIKKIDAFIKSGRKISLEMLKII